MKFTVMIATHNRRDDLRRTCERLRALRPAPQEVLICADGCTDGTQLAVCEEYPEFTLIDQPDARGSVATRDRLLRLATGDIVLSLDDDSYPLQDDFLVGVATVFDAHPEAAVVTFPELRDGDQYADENRTPQRRGHYVSAYANCAAAMRREFYLARPGFPLFFGHMYEELDYALQCYGAGAAVWFEPSLTIRHHLSPQQRAPVRRHHFNARNELWSVWMRCPWPWLPLVSLFRVWRQFRYACTEKVGWACREPWWWASALAGVRRCVRHRQALPWSVYYRWMRLARRPAFEMENL